MKLLDLREIKAEPKYILGPEGKKHLVKKVTLAVRARYYELMGTLETNQTYSESHQDWVVFWKSLVGNGGEAFWAEVDTDQYAALIQGLTNVILGIAQDCDEGKPPAEEVTTEGKPPAEEVTTPSA